MPLLHADTGDHATAIDMDGQQHQGEPLASSSSGGSATPPHVRRASPSIVAATAAGPPTRTFLPTAAHPGGNSSALHSSTSSSIPPANPNRLTSSPHDGQLASRLGAPSTTVRQRFPFQMMSGERVGSGTTGGDVELVDYGVGRSSPSAAVVATAGGAGVGGYAFPVDEEEGEGAGDAMGQLVRQDSDAMPTANMSDEAAIRTFLLALERWGVLYHCIQATTSELSGPILSMTIVRTLTMYIAAAAAFGAFFMAVPSYHLAYAFCCVVNLLATSMRLVQLQSFNASSKVITRKLVEIRLKFGRDRRTASVVSHFIHATRIWPLSAEPFGLRVTPRVLGALVTAFLAFCFAILQLWVIDSSLGTDSTP
jgi:hypothetical protein